MFECHLDEDVFLVVKNGTKIIEARVYDEKRRKMKIGDQLVFIKRPLMEERINTNIIDLKVYNNFNELVKDYSIDELYLPDFSKEEYLKLLERFYSKEEQDEFGVVAIKFEIV